MRLLSTARHDPFQMEYGTFRCLECGTLFPSEISIEAHIQKKHITKAIFTCVICQKAFKDAWHLKKHENMHETSKVMCATCKQTFKNSENLSKHQEVGLCSEEKMEDVVEWFEWKDGWKAEVKELVCRVCGVLVTSENFYDHLETHSSELYQWGGLTLTPVVLRPLLCSCNKPSLSRVLGLTEHFR